MFLVSCMLFGEYFLVVTSDPYPNKEIFTVLYRKEERLAANRAYADNPSLITKGAYLRELRLMHQHEDWKRYPILGVLVVANVIGIRIFMRCGKTKNKTEPHTPTMVAGSYEK